MASITITPAYGRDYKSANTALADWENGKDFMLAAMNGRPAGQYCSIRDFAPSTEVSIRYARETKKLITHVKGS